MQYKIGVDGSGIQDGKEDARTAEVENCFSGMWCLR
jgi:hypothetical protein